MDQCFESLRCLLERQLKEKGFDRNLSLVGGQNPWLKLHACLVKTSIERAVGVAVDIFGKTICKNVITVKTLHDLCHKIHEIDSSVTKSNGSVSKSIACVLGLSKLISYEQNNKLKVEVDILYSILLDEDHELHSLLETSEGGLNQRGFVFTRCKHLSLIHLAVLWNSNNALRVLLDFSNSIIVNQSDVYGMTALHYAVCQGHVLSAKLLLQRGLDPNAKLMSKITALHLAAYQVFPRLVLLLCKHGADVHCKDTKGNTPLLVATSSKTDIREKLGDHSKVISLLLRYGSSPEERNLRNETPLHNVSLSCFDISCVHLLLAAGAKLDKLTPTKHPAIRHFLEIIREKMPSRLELLCTIAVRNILGTGFGNKVKELKLPRDMEMILLFQKLPKLY